MVVPGHCDGESSSGRERVFGEEHSHLAYTASALFVILTVKSDQPRIEELMSLHHLVSQRGTASLPLVPTPSTPSLPPEILEFIFEECVAQAHAHNGKGWQFHYCDHRCLLDWVQITHVCSLWRTISTERKGLWSHIVFFSAKWTRTMLDRAGASPLVVSARFDETIDHVELLSSLLENVGRIEDLHFEGSEPDGYRLAQALDSVSGCLGTVALRSLALLQIPQADRTGYHTSRLPTSLSRDCTLKKLYLRGFGLSDNDFRLETMNVLEELWLENDIQSDNIEGSLLHLPNLTHLHLAVSPYDCPEVFAALRLSRPLQYFGFEIEPSEERGSFLFTDASINLSHCIGIRNVDQTSEGNLTVALRIGLDGGPCYDESEFILAAWPRNIAGPSHVMNYARQGIIPLLPYDTAQWSTDTRLQEAAEVLEVRSSFTRTNPCLYVSSWLEGYMDPKFESNCLPMLAKAFTLCDVVFVSFSNCFYLHPRQENMRSFLRSMPSLHIIEGRFITPALLTIALAPQDGYVPMPKLSEVWLFNILRPFQAEDDDDEQMYRGEIEMQASAPTLLACLTARVQAGTTLAKLRLTRCEPLDVRERESIVALGTEVEEIQCQGPSTAP
ncbi:hypothetical protein CONPUDRAFT_144326 [Coniophora puteana RWD-64-598 SS2]|uniref:Uncharacterized protein n=1 Tax=Coniophora puteana (strain RWD-64-598) TaxID=741705 RepID=A0A5M3MRD0_CONPW|nr:uncharacterized protein CONPUDRAFT_144326 [Coniophora puteana RWD-64-598 SS2]EIW81640.1 hypothetical protein CONPUDRAFT_144326 [Coniophora puteana RWD-64-598 SS2]